MAKHNNSNSSSRNDHGYVPASVLASCYALDVTGTSPAALTGFHYCTTPAAGPECPPLAAIAANRLTLLPKAVPSTDSRRRRRTAASGGAFRIREECERLFCETMAAVFPGERSTAGRVSGLTGVYYENGGGAPVAVRRASDASAVSDMSGVDGDVNGDVNGNVVPTASYAYSHPLTYLEIYDFVGGGSFRAFVAADGAGARSLFVFFDASVMARDVKSALVALIELGDTLGCAHVVLCVDRKGPAEARAALLKGLQWAGFSLTTLDLWTGGVGVDVTSARWLFMGMEV